MFTRGIILSIVLPLSWIPPIVEAGMESGAAAFHKEDYQTAYQELRPLAEAGDPKAQYYIGFMYYSGKGVVQNSVEAVKWIKPAAESGVAEAQYLFALMTESGLVGPKRKKDAHKTEAIPWLTLAAEQGHVNAQIKLADRYLQGEGVPRDLVQAYVWCGIAHLLAPSRCTPQEYIPTYQMTSAQQDAAKQRVQEWVANHPVNPTHSSAKSAQHLIAELDHAGYKRRQEIKASLIRMGDSASPAILGTFRAKTPKHVDFLTGVLCERGPAAVGAVPELIRLFQNKTITPSIKHHFVQSLGCVGTTSAEAQALLISLTKGGDEAIRPWAVMSLERFDSREAILALAEALSDPRRSVRESAAGALSKMGPKAAPAIPALGKAMGQKGTYLSMLAADALQAIGTPEAKAELKKHGKEDDLSSPEDDNDGGATFSDSFTPS